MKIQIGKRYVLRDGRVTCPLEANPRKTSDFPFAGTAGAGNLSWREDGRWSDGFTNYSRDIVAEYAEPVDPEFGTLVVFKSGTFHREGTPDFDYLAAGNAAGWTRATLYEGDAIEKPAAPTPEDGWLYYGTGPVKELPLHYTHGHVKFWHENVGQWEIGKGILNSHYAVKAGTQLAILCGLESLKLEAGKRYVLADGRVTGPLAVLSATTVCAHVLDSPYSYACQWFVDGDSGSSNVPNISHPYSE